MRRCPIVLAPLLVLALAASGCGGTAAGPQARRKTFLQSKDIQSLNDQELAKVCPSLYPSDYLDKNRAKHYHYTVAKKPFTPTANQVAEAKQAGCTPQGTKPKK
jgi:hypothetical protein